jgi:hypothetical protein
MMDWNDIVKIVTTNAILMAILGFVAKSIFDQFLSRDIENHKTKLQAAHDIELEKLKSDLNKLTFEHQIVFSRLHETRANVIAKLYELLVEAESKYNGLLIDKYVTKQPDEEGDKIKSAVEKWSELNIYLSHNRIYFDGEVCKKLDQIIQAFTESTINYLYLDDMDTTKQENAQRVFLEKVGKEIPEVKRLIESRFRDLLGIRDK